MVFQNFALASERRRQEREQKFRKKVTIAAVSFCVAVVIIACVAFAIASHLSKNNQDNSRNARPVTKKPQPKKAEHTKQVTRTDSTIKMVCNATTYKDSCHTSLKTAVAKNSSLSQPKDFVKVAMQAAFDEIDKAFAKASEFKFNTPQEKAAFEDCKELINNAKEETKNSIGFASEDAAKVTKRVPDINNWLSAVMSYQETCIDGFLDGQLKTDMNNTFKSAKELTSNSLAMVSSLASLVSSLHSSGGNRSLLGKESNSLVSVEKDGLPYWMSHEDRRMLKGADTDNPTPNVTVAQDGSGQFKTISAALAAMPAKYDGRYVIFVKEGIYNENVTVTKDMVNVTMYGIGSQKTVVTGNKNFVDGVQTFRTATFAVLGDGFLCKAMGFRNTAGAAKHQAVALRVQADRTVFLNCRFEGYQDTLYVQTHRQFYRSCVISGTVDFIFGDAAAIFQNCQIMVRKPLDNQQNIITAQGRIDPHETTGIVLQTCRIEPDKDFVPAKATINSYLGRPWKLFSRTIVLESIIEDLIHPHGWLPWAGNQGLNTLYYAEYKNTGPGAKTDARVKWPGYHVITNSKEAEKYTVGPFIQGEWISATGSIVHFGLN